MEPTTFTSIDGMKPMTLWLAISRVPGVARDLDEMTMLLLWGSSRIDCSSKLLSLSRMAGAIHPGVVSPGRFSPTSEVRYSRRMVAFRFRFKDVICISFISSSIGVCSSSLGIIWRTRIWFNTLLQFPDLDFQLHGMPSVTFRYLHLFTPTHH
jgi:hypothetical protein